MLLISGKRALCGWLLVMMSGEAWAGEGSKSLQLMVWGGSHGSMLEHAVVTPFAALTNTRVNTHTRDAGAVDLKADGVDVVEMELQEAIDACDRGDLSLLPASEFRDFVPNAVQPCAVGQYLWSTVYAYNRHAHRSDDQPSLITDFFNVQHYPGRRAVRRSPRVISEWALLAAGVPASAIYDTLSDPDQAWQIIEGVLNPLAQSIVWVDDDAEAIEMLRDGKVSFAMVGSDALIRSVAAGADNLYPVWDGSVNQMSLWAIPVESNDPELAWQFVRYATSVDVTRRFSAISGYGPSRFSSLDQISRAYHDYLPSNRSNLDNVIWGDSGWWRGEGRALDMRFVNWLADQFVKSSDS